MMSRSIVLILALALCGLIDGAHMHLRRASADARALAKAYAKAKVGAKLPWPMLDADGGEEYEEGNEEDSESDPKTFSLSQYEHTDARDDADVAEDEDFEDDELTHGESDPEDSQDEQEEDGSFLQLRATVKKSKTA